MQSFPTYLTGQHCQTKYQDCHMARGRGKKKKKKKKTPRFLIYKLELHNSVSCLNKRPCTCFPGKHCRQGHVCKHDTSASHFVCALVKSSSQHRTTRQLSHCLNGFWRSHRNQAVHVKRLHVFALGIFKTTCFEFAWRAV